MFQNKNGMGVLPDLPIAVCLASTANCQVGATTNTAITYAAATVTGSRLSPGNVAASYDATPTAGAITVTDYAGTNTYFSIDITAAGAAPLAMLKEVWLPISTGMKVTIAASAGAKGKLNCYHLEQKVGV